MSRKLAWTDAAWNDYLYWQSQDKKTLKRINRLIQEAKKDPFEGIGKPEPLRENLSGFWSRRIDESNRLVYAVDDQYLTVKGDRHPQGNTSQPLLQLADPKILISSS